jgi:hypothetical protein
VKALRVHAGLAAVLCFLTHARRAVAEDTPPNDTEYFQYGVAVVAEAALSGGDVCPTDTVEPCILGSGGGLAIRVGYRARDPWYFGGAYEFSRHESSNLLKLGVLQQVRAEGRYYFDRGQRATGFLAGGFGLHLYGNEWSAETGGGLATLGGGVEFQISATTVVGGAVMYRLLVPRAWTDSAGVRRADRLLGFGVAHLLALEFTIEVREPLPRW